MLVDQLRDEPRQMLARQPIIQRWQQQQPPIRVEHPKGLIHPRLRRQRMPIYPFGRINIEQPTIPTTRRPTEHPGQRVTDPRSQAFPDHAEESVSASARPMRLLAPA